MAKFNVFGFRCIKDCFTFEAKDEQEAIKKAYDALDFGKEDDNGSEVILDEYSNYEDVVRFTASEELPTDVATADYPSYDPSMAEARLYAMCLDYFGKDCSEDIEEQLLNDPHELAVNLLSAFMNGKAKHYFKTNEELEEEDGAMPYTASSFGVSDKDFV